MDFAEFLNQKGVVTRFEAARIREGHSERLLLGDYVLREPIGSGSLGTTYLAERRTDKQKFSVMVLPLRSIWHVHQAKKVVEHFADFPGHPSVVPLVDIDTANQFHYLAWPYVEGDTLEHMVSKRGPYVVNEVIKIATSIVEALAFCKKFSIIHGYLRPSKIIHPRKGGVTIIEWGVGAILSENIDVEDSFLDTISSATAVTQSIDCVAPELFANPLARTEFTDQYALGCTLYFLLTGQFPFPHGTIVEKMIAHQTHTPTPLTDRVRRIPAEISEMIDRLLAKNPANRFPDWNEPLAILRTASQGMMNAEPTTAAISQLMDTIESEAVSTPNTKSRKTIPYETDTFSRPI